MEEVVKWIVLLKIISFSGISAETYTVKVGTESHVNVVDEKFLSFTVDPKYLFLSDDKFNSKECTCMASALAPAYIRIAGPSTELMTLRNSTISLEDLDLGLGRLEAPGLSVSHSQWSKFASWSKATGFELVFGLNNHEQTSTGIWDPNTALSILTVAEKGDVGDVFWQLGYECKNQSIEEYLTDLQTLRVIVDTFPPRGWGVVGGDIAPCLEVHSKSDFKDYVTLSNEMLDAVLLDGNSSTHELDRMSERDRTRLLTTLAKSSTPLWMTEKTLEGPELVRAASWMHSLGHAARNGFSAHFRELLQDELIQPTLSFYMALLFKNLVGERVLSVDFDVPSERTSLFAHCTSLRHKPVPGAVTLFGANLDDEPARFSLKLGRKEEGGDIMQFILGLDVSGNIIVNGRAMYYEGDIKPVVRRVRPYKTLLVNLPAKSFGFWVLANTKTAACQETPVSTEKKMLAAIRETEDNGIVNLDEEARSKRSAEVELEESSRVHEGTNVALLKRIDSINKDLKSIHKLTRHERVTDNDVYDLKRERRQVRDDKKTFIEKLNLKPRRPIVAPKTEIKKVVKQPKLEAKPKLSFASRLAELHAKLNSTRQQRKERAKKLLTRNKVIKRSSTKHPEVKFPELLPNQRSKSVLSEDKVKEPTPHKAETLVVDHTRTKRSIISKKKKFEKEIEELLPENEIDLDDGKYLKFGKILHKINEQLNDIADDTISSNENSSLEEQLTVSTKISGDEQTIKLTEKSNGGIFKSAVSKVLTLLEELTHKFDSVFNTVDVLH